MMYHCTILDVGLKRCFGVVASTATEAVREAWKLSAVASSGDDSIDWVPEGGWDDLQITVQLDPDLTRLQPVPDHIDEPMILADSGHPIGFVVPGV